MIKQGNDFSVLAQIYEDTVINEDVAYFSKLAKERVEKVEDVVKLGDEILVKAIGTDNKGRLNFSRRDALK